MTLKNSSSILSCLTNGWLYRPDANDEPQCGANCDTTRDIVMMDDFSTARHSLASIDSSARRSHCKHSNHPHFMRG